MTVKELIEALKKAPQDKIVRDNDSNEIDIVIYNLREDEVVIKVD